MTDLPYPYLDPAHYPTVDPEIIRAIQADLDELNRRLASVTPPGGSASAHVIQDEGVSLTQRTTLNFAGAGVTAADSGGKTVVTIPGGSGGYATVQDEGSSLTQRTVIDFQGAGVTAADSGGKTVVTIPSGVGRSDYLWTPPTGALVENIPRYQATAGFGITSGRLTVNGGVTLRAGVTYSSVTFLATTAATNLTHSWACLVRVSDRQILAVSADNTTAPWAINTPRTFTFATPYTPVTDEVIWTGLLVAVSSGSPAFASSAPLAWGGHASLAPQWGGRSTLGLTTPLAVATVIDDPAVANYAVQWCSLA